MSCLVFSCGGLRCVFVSSLVFFFCCVFLCCVVLCYLALSYLALSYLAVSCLVLSCLSCRVVSCCVASVVSCRVMSLSLWLSWSLPLPLSLSLSWSLSWSLLLSCLILSCLARACLFWLVPFVTSRVALSCIVLFCRALRCLVFILCASYRCCCLVFVPIPALPIVLFLSHFVFVSSCFVPVLSLLFLFYLFIWWWKGWEETHHQSRSVCSTRSLYYWLAPLNLSSFISDWLPYFWFRVGHIFGLVKFATIPNPNPFVRGFSYWALPAGDGINPNFNPYRNLSPRPQTPKPVSNPYSNPNQP